MDAQKRVDFCPHCGNKTPKRQLAEYFYSGTPDAEPDDIQMGTYYLAVCETCNEALLYVLSADEYIRTNTYSEPCFAYPDTYLIWPKDNTALYYAVPSTIRQVYGEAARIKKVAPHAFAGQVRRALEALCEDRGVKGRNLYEKLGKLSSRGEIPQTLAEMSDVVRLIGNIGVHFDTEKVEDWQVDAVDDFFRAIIEYVYIAPDKLQRYKGSLELRRKSNEQKAAGRAF